jgi:hypothetical protein
VARQFVRVMHPFHPLFGRQLQDVIFRQEHEPGRLGLAALSTPLG